MSRARFLLAAVLACFPLAAGRAQSAGDDFFAYANEAWLRDTRIPPGMDRWNARTEIDALVRRQLIALLDDAASAAPGTLARKVADFHAAFLDGNAIEARGNAPLTPLLDSIERVRDRAALTALLGRWLAADVDPLNWGDYRSAHPLGLAVEPGIHGESTNLAFLVQGGLGLPDREPYLGTAPGMQALRDRYVDYVGHQLALAGFDRAQRRARGVMALETAIARTHAPREVSANDRNADHRWTRADFARRAPGLDWSAFFTAAGLGERNEFIVWQPTAVTGLAALVASEPLAHWKDYLRFHVVHRHADVLPRAFAEQAVAFQQALTYAPPPARGARAVAATQAAMGEALGRIYVERHFPPERKAQVEAIVANVVAAFTARVERATWMSPETRARALGKLRTLYFGIGYPERWQDYDDLAVDAGDAFGNLRRAAARDYRRALARLGAPVDRRQWWIAPQAVGAVLVFQQNAYNFPAAFLQPPKFDPAASEASNYGAIGAIAGHEISHFVDLLGADWDAEGRYGRWWSAEDVARFEAEAGKLVHQVSGYTPFPDLAVSGERTRTESVADLGGLAAAFDAHRRALGARAADTAYVRQQDREFFIGFARGWRGVMTDAALRAYLAGDSHAPERYRIAIVRNLDAWYDAFGVMPGQRLYLEPAARVRIW
jgi:predicted metalloendopeptidase